MQQFDSRITWEKLSLELDLLSTEPPNSLAPLLVGMNSVLWPQESPEWAFRRLGFMAYELQSRCEGCQESDRLEILNRYFFKDQGFQVRDLENTPPEEDDFLLHPTLVKKQGHAVAISLIYIHLASHLDLPVYMVDLPQRYILKWVRAGKSSFIDLSDNGRILTDEEILNIANKHLIRTDNCEAKDGSCFEVLPGKKIVMLYTEDLIRLYELQNKCNQLHIVLNIALKLDPANLPYLKRRALLCRELGLHREALSDIKRYFSFTNKQQAPTDLKMLFYELQSIVQMAPNPADYLH